MEDYLRERIERELEFLVSTVRNTVSSLKEIRVFGSYNNGSYLPEKSDIDIFILLKNYPKIGLGIDHLATKEFLRNYKRGKLLSEIRKKLLTRGVDWEFDFTIMDTEELRVEWNNNRRNLPTVFGEDLTNGRLLYSAI